MKRLWLLLVAVSWQLPAGTASAASLTTPFAYAPPGTGGIACYFTNVGKKALEVTVSIRQGDNSIKDDDVFILQPGESGALRNNSGDYSGRCQFDFKGLSKALRAATLMFESTSTPNAGIVYFPAQ